jgi:hypothetical protein
MGLVYNYQDVTVPYPGTVTASLDWTYATSDIDMVVARATDCPATSAGEVYYGTCTALGADRTSRKPATVTFNMPAAGTIGIFIYSFSSVPESGVLNVTIVH